MSRLKRIVLGDPLASAEEEHQRLGKPVGLAVFASDAISSTAYASQEILIVLLPVAGLTVALHQLVPISIIVMVLLTLVTISYHQTIHAYPSGGGSYIVSRENLGEMPGLVAGASLLVDYILTVAVSVSAGVAAITSAFPELYPERVLLCLGFVGIMTLANLRGLKESGRLFAGPTYVYVVALSALIVVGLIRAATGHLPALPPNQEAIDEFTENGELLTGMTAILFMRAFASGAVALTGVEAISNGVPAFRKPESRNAAITLMWMSTILGTAFFGISLLANQLKPTPSETETLLSTMGRAVFDGETIPYYVLQFSTFAILILAANTAFADFPRVGSILARDSYMPRQLSNRGDRLVFSNGVLSLAAVAGALIVTFGGNTSRLIPLYAVGVFCGFTLSQLGMVVHHKRLQEPNWRRHQAINLTGAIATFAVLIVIVVSKFVQGAWIPVVLIPIIVLNFKLINRHYVRVRRALDVPAELRVARHAHTVIVPVGKVNRAVLRSIAYARSMTPEHLIAISVVTSPEEQHEMEDAWERHRIPVELRTVYSPYRDLTGPLLRTIDEIDAARPDDVITVVLSEFVVEHWWEHPLHNQSALLLKSRLRRRRNTVVTSVPVHVSDFQDEFEPVPTTSRSNRPAADGEPTRDAGAPVSAPHAEPIER